MQVSVVTTSMRRRHRISSRSFAASRGSWPSRSQCAKSMQRALVVAGTAQRAPLSASFFRYSRPPSPMTSMSPIMWTLVTGTRRLAPQKRPTSIWYPSARRGASPREPARIARSSAVRSKLLALPGLRRKVLLELAGDFLPRVGIRRRGALARDVRPLDREIGVQLEPLLGLRVGVGQDRLRRALGLAHAAVDALVGMDHEHVLALVEAIHRAHLDAVHVLALDAVFGDDVSHGADYTGGRAARRKAATGQSWISLQRRIKKAIAPCCAQDDHKAMARPAFLAPLLIIVGAALLILTAG